MKTAMENIKEMVDVNTIIGEPVETADGNTIIPVSKVGFGFAAGGSEFQAGQKFSVSEERKRDSSEGGSGKSYPFGGGSGGGVSITPVGFIVIEKSGVRLLSMESSTRLYERLMDFAPQLVEKLQELGKKKKSTKSKAEHHEC
jgi:sporulation protein YtfJ